MNETEKILSDLIAIRTDDPSQGNCLCVDYICRILASYQITYERIVCSDSQVENIIAGINVAELRNIQKGLILSGHIDTVGADINMWNSNPFEAIFKEGRIYGRGTADMKYFIAVVLSLLSEFKKVDYPIFLIFSGDEETNVNGVQQLIKFMTDRNIHPCYALIGEPTNFDMCLAHNGYSGFTTYVEGAGGHSSCPDCGTNAIYVAAKISSKIEDLNRCYQPLHTTLNVGVIKGGIGRNSIAGSCYLDWDIRYASDAHCTQILEEMRKFYDDLRKQYKNLNISYEITEQIPSFERCDNGQFIKIASELLKSNDIYLSFATEAGFFKKYGVETVVCGGADRILLHTANEYILSTDLIRYREFLMSLIQRINL